MSNWCRLSTFRMHFGPQQQKNTPMIASSIRITYVHAIHTYFKYSYCKLRVQRQWSKSSLHVSIELQMVGQTPECFCCASAMHVLDFVTSGVTVCPTVTGWYWVKTNKCIGDDTKAAARQSLNCIKNKNKIKYGEKRLSIWRMEVLYPAMWHDHDIAFVRWPPCNVAYGSGIVTVNSASDSTLQCDRPMWLWDDMPLNLPKRPPYSNSTSGFHFHISPQSTCHYVPVCEIWSKSDYLGRTKWRRVDFQDGVSQPSWIVGIQ